MKNTYLNLQILNFTTSSRVQSPFQTRDYKLGNPKFKLSPQWVTGIADSEGNFSVLSFGSKKLKVAINSL